MSQVHLGRDFGRFCVLCSLHPKATISSYRARHSATTCPPTRCDLGHRLGGRDLLRPSRFGILQLAVLFGQLIATWRDCELEDRRSENR